MKRQNYGPRLGKLVFQLPGDVTSAYYLRLGLQNGFGSSGPEKLLKIVSCEKTERDNGGAPSGIGGWPPISTWITIRPKNLRQEERKTSESGTKDSINDVRMDVSHEEDLQQQNSPWKWLDFLTQ